MAHHLDGHYLIIGGTTKAATTSLFNYLADHPEVCASKNKETRFFLDEDYPVPLRDHHIRQGIAAYENFFERCAPSKLRLEATPDYLYSPNTATRLNRYLPQAKLIFILRDPIDRLHSWYRFAQQNNDLSEEVTFEVYVREQLGGTPKREQHWLVLEQGRYVKYLKHFAHGFNKKNILLVHYGLLSAGPASVLRQICQFAKIDDTFYQQYDFKVHNKTQTMKNPRMHQIIQSGKRAVRKRVASSPHLHKWLRNINRNLEPAYLKLNRQEVSKDQWLLSSSTRQTLMGFYEREYQILGSLKTSLLEDQPQLL